MARGFTRTRARPTRRLTTWDATPPQTAYQAMAAATVILDTTFTATSPVTIVRVRGQLSIQSDQSAADEQPFGAVGLCVVSDEAAAVGVTAMPKPYIDAESDLWLLHEFWACPIQAGSDASFAVIDQNLRLDTKGMRKFSEDQTLVMMIENAHSAHGVIYRLDLRLLVMIT